MRNFAYKLIGKADPQFWYFRIPVIAYIVYTYTRLLDKPDYSAHRMSNFFNALDMGMHELGHKLFIPFGEFMTILGGSLFQCIFPLMWLAVFVWKKFYFGAAMCLCWLGFNFYDVATYAADARVMLLDLAGGPGSTDADYESGHDWHQILLRTGHLAMDQQIAGWLRTAGNIVIIAGLVLGTAILAAMIYRWYGRGQEERIAEEQIEANRVVLNVERPYFNAIVAGTKTLEGRLAKEKILNIGLGDKIDFECDGQRITKTVVTKYPYPTFEAAFKAHDFHAAIPDAQTVEEALAVYERFYPRDVQDRTGVVFLRII